MTEPKYILKEGELTLKSGLLNKKHKRWCHLSKGPEGIVTLEAFENKDQKEKIKNSFTLVNVKSIDKIVKESSKEFVIDVHTKKEKFSLLLANTSETESWYDYLQDYSRFSEGREDSSTSTTFDDDNDDGLKDNILYGSNQPTAENVAIDVELKHNEDVESRGLKVTNKYRLHVTPVCLMLEDLDEKEQKFKWFYEHLRKYGKGKNEFTIVSGRKSDSGVGTFVFALDNPALITKAIDRLTNRKHNEQLTSKFEQSSEQASLNRMSEPLRNREPSPVPPRQATSLKEKDESKTPLQRQNSANLAKTITADFKHELEDKVNKNLKNSKKDKHEDKKKGFTLFNKSSKKDEKKHKDNDNKTEGKKVYPHENLYDEPDIKPEVHETPEPMYEETDKPTKPRSGKKHVALPSQEDQNLYAQANTDRKQAWKEQGIQDHFHMEEYADIKLAAQQPGQRSSVGLKPNYDEELDDTYDHVILADKTKEKIRNSANSNNIYGVASGKEVHTPEADYDDDPVEYYDAASTEVLRNSSQNTTPVDAYEEVDLVR